MAGARFHWSGIRPASVVATERLIDSTDFRRSANEVAVVEMVIVQLLVRGKRLLHAQKRAPVGVVHEIVFAIQGAVAFSAHPVSEFTLEPIAQGGGFVDHTQLIGDGQNFRQATHGLTVPVRVIGGIPIASATGNKILHQAT